MLRSGLATDFTVLCMSATATACLTLPVRVCVLVLCTAITYAPLQVQQECAHHYQGDVHGPAGGTQDVLTGNLSLMVLLVCCIAAA